MAYGSASMIRTILGDVAVVFMTWLESFVTAGDGVGEVTVGHSRINIGLFRRAKKRDIERGIADRWLCRREIGREREGDFGGKTTV